MTVTIGSISISSPAPKTSLTIERSRTLLSQIDDEQARRIYAALAPRFALDEVGPINESGTRFMAMGATVEISEERPAPNPVIMVTIPVTIALFGDDATAFLGEMEDRA